ncbi:MAG: inositol monophosphatase [Acidimicrobiaceae bacterium]|jgi:myo-inositol-1(or 4)-monophosphatase|nr:inositol monophosphatase [Acidimicrobiaceae bacterium]|tara:strand:+ start:24015 stop:24803 length:789 start_codon:yes stop_codon:yes gene_type:complete
MIDQHGLRDIALECVATVKSSINIDSSIGQRATPKTKSSSSDYVTWLDFSIESKIIQFIKETRSQDGFLGEEGTDDVGTSGVRWIIDPIDGTTNFVYGIPFFGISIAVQVKGETIAGVVADLGSNEVFDAVKGHGSRCNGVAINASINNSLQSAIVATGFSYQSDRRKIQGSMLQHILPRIGDIRRFGAAAIDLCWLASGRVDAFYEEGLNLWDYAAGCLIASEAGSTIKIKKISEDIELLIASNASLGEDFNMLITESLDR